VSAADTFGSIALDREAYVLISGSARKRVNQQSVKFDDLFLAVFLSIVESLIDFSREFQSSQTVAEAGSVCINASRRISMKVIRILLSAKKRFLPDCLTGRQYSRTFMGCAIRDFRFVKIKKGTIPELTFKIDLENKYSHGSITSTYTVYIFF
jgi:hypothetical protein